MPASWRHSTRTRKPPFFHAFQIPNWICSSIVFKISGVKLHTLFVNYLLLMQMFVDQKWRNCALISRGSIANSERDALQQCRYLSRFSNQHSAMKPQLNNLQNRRECSPYSPLHRQGITFQKTNFFTSINQQWKRGGGKVSGPRFTSTLRFKIPFNHVQNQ